MKVDTIELFENLERKRNKIRELQNEVRIETLEYRIKSVAKVLDSINTDCWRKKETKDLQTLMVHCLNKLNGNIDGTELKLEE